MHRDAIMHLPLRPHITSHIRRHEVLSPFSPTISSNVGEDLFTQDMQGSEDDMISAVPDATAASSSLMRLADGDRSS